MSKAARAVLGLVLLATTILARAFATTPGRKALLDALQSPNGLASVVDRRLTTAVRQRLRATGAEAEGLEVASQAGIHAIENALGAGLATPTLDQIEPRARDFILALAAADLAADQVPPRFGAALAAMAQPLEEAFWQVR